jgi:hypothetical protein
VAFELDCSGADQSHPLCQGRTGEFKAIESLSTRSAVIVDLDNDGDLDIVTNEMNDRPQILISNLSERKKLHFLKVKLVGTKSNRDGLGAVVTVQTENHAQTMVQDGKAGYFSFGALPLYFGLEDGSNIETVQVAWPSGQHQSVRDGIPQNGLLTLTEP